MLLKRVYSTNCSKLVRNVKMVAGARGPPRLLCMLVQVLLAMASFFCIFMLMGMQLFPTTIHDQMPSSLTTTTHIARMTHEELAAAPEQQQGFQYGRVWSPVPSLRHLLPYSTPRDASYHAPVFPGTGFLFSTIRGELHQIHAAVCDLVVIARLLNATIVLPKIQGVMSVKGGSSSKVQSFSYLYDEQHFMAALKEDVRVVKLLPKKLRTRARLQKQPVKTPTRISSVQYYMDEILPALAVHGACGLVFSDGGGLQSLLPPELAAYQRLRCRVAFHALRFRREIQDLGVQLVRRLEVHGRPHVVVHLGLERDVLAYHGCAELFQDLQTESIQLQRNHFLTIGKEVGDLHIDSQKQRHRGLCPLMPAEVGLLLESYGFHNNTRIYLAGTETTGGQRLLLPLRSMYANLEDCFTLSTMQERSALHGTPPKTSISVPGRYDSAFATTLKKLLFGRKAGPAVQKGSQKGWWRRVGDCESHTEDHFANEGEGKDMQLIHAALDYIVSLEANTFFPAFDKDRHGLPNVASLVLGHRLYQSASLKTFHPNRSALVALLDEYPPKHPHNLSSWGVLVKKLLMDSLLLRPKASSQTVKADLFLSHPVPECACQTQRADKSLLWEGVAVCPAWMVSQY